MVNLDFSSIPSREPLEEGVYTLRIAKVEEKVAQNSGNPMLKVEYDVVEQEGRKLWDNFVLIDSCLWKIKELLDALSMDTTSVVDLDPNDLVGGEVQAKVIQEDYQGDIVNRVKKIYAPKA